MKSGGGLLMFQERKLLAWLRGRRRHCSKWLRLLNHSGTCHAVGDFLASVVAWSGNCDYPVKQQENPVDFAYVANESFIEGYSAPVCHLHLQTQEPFADGSAPSNIQDSEIEHFKDT
jgi:hypothetical protein